ncbi:MAG: SpoIID/LytB domain-containing protein [Phycisphaerae bacterium]
MEPTPKSPGRRLTAGWPAAILAVTTACIAAGLLSCGREPRVETEQPLTVSGVPTIRVLLPVDAPVELSTTRGYRMEADGRLVSRSNARLGETTVRRREGKWFFNSFDVPGDRVVLQSDLGGFIRVNGVLYRGSLHLLAREDDGIRVVNHVDLESYLAGVLPRELYPHWHLETYRAQAVAARTYALYHMSTRGKGRDYDIGSTQGWQVYGGFSAENERAWEAVRSTHGTVLAHGPEGEERIFQAHYSAACGGRVNPVEVLYDPPGETPMVGGQECTDCSDCPRYRWDPVRISKKEMHAALVGTYSSAAQLRGIEKVRVLSSTEWGRPLYLELADSEGASIRLRAEDLRVALLRSGSPAARGLYSMNCRIRDLGEKIEFFDGRGFGHGVGLCQWGSEGKAADGWSAEEILKFYYRGAKLFRAY